MLEPNKEKEKKRRRSAIFFTAFFNCIIAILLFLVSWTEPDPLPKPEEIILEFAAGSEASSGGNPDVTQTVNDVTPEVAEHVITDPVNTTHTVASSNSSKPSNSTNTANTQTVNQNALFNPTGNNGGPGGENIGSNPGAGNNGLGGTGNTPYKAGNGMSLNGREQVYFPKPNNPDFERGKVVMIIRVNKMGVVTSAVADPTHSTTNDATLIEECKKALIGKQLVKENPNAPDEQRGYYEFEFRVE